MEHNEKLQWLATWAVSNGLQLKLDGECGFGRECVGVLANDNYPDYEWYSDDYDRIDDNGDVWMPEDAYHKHPCVAVLGRGEAAESQLYDWCKWFDDNGFKLETGNRKTDSADWLDIVLGRDKYARMVRQS